MRSELIDVEEVWWNFHVFFSCAQDVASATFKMFDELQQRKSGYICCEHLWKDIGRCSLALYRKKQQISSDTISNDDDDGEYNPNNKKRRKSRKVTDSAISDSVFSLSKYRFLLHDSTQKKSTVLTISNQFNNHNKYQNRSQQCQC